MLTREISLPVKRSPIEQLLRTKLYVQEQGVNTERVEYGMSRSLGITTNSPEALGYACSIASVQNMEIVEVCDRPFPEEIAEVLYEQLFGEEGRGKNLHADYAELKERVQNKKICFIVASDISKDHNRRGAIQCPGNPFHSFLEDLIETGSAVRILHYGGSANNLPEAISTHLLPI